MPAGEIAGELIGGLFRLVGQFFVETVGEILVRGVGNAICRRFSTPIDPDGALVVVVGLLFWIAIFGLGYVCYIHAAEWLAADRCLNSGGTYDDVAEKCRDG